MATYLPVDPPGDTMNHSRLKILDQLSAILALLFTLDRLLRLFAVMHFFRRPAPPQPMEWPTISILQPISRGINNLHHSLQARALLDYPNPPQHLLICDAQDTESLTKVRTFLKELPMLQAEIVLVETTGAPVASKLRKLQAALPRATGQVLCFIDDDVAPHPDALKVLIPYLYQPRVGAAFGLPCYSNWQTLWSSLMSGFVNANMLLSFVPPNYLSSPLRLVGHLVVFRRDSLMQAGGLNGLERHIDDDYAIAERLREHGLHLVQTPLVYNVDNELRSRKAYEVQLNRWFVLAQQAMMPLLSPRERIIPLISSFPIVLPTIISLLALLTRSRSALRSLITVLGIFGATYTVCEIRYLRHRTPPHRWPLLIIIALLTPLQMLKAVLSGDEIEWRGQRLRISRDGRFEDVPAKHRPTTGTSETIRETI
jgi:ceramide glucosyltransferase